ncbi:hypothetical protein [Streptomyces hilarionis]|uniref:hypothetical protein n=1 Tax=Streptomyces hilarionis TaxID=2839954 RepID=UPI00211A2C6F|nr:hypothetical protein [Streptomyces hilarionis]MCQ9129264.1 hypothetical protein [Streptomyces hilarionis]
MEAHAGVRELIFLDECGFAPTLATDCTRSCIGRRGAPRGRWVNVLGAQIIGTGPALLSRRTSVKIDAGTLWEVVLVHLAGPGGGAAVLDLAADGLGVDVMPVRRPGPTAGTRTPCSTCPSAMIRSVIDARLLTRRAVKSPGRH